MTASTSGGSPPRAKSSRLDEGPSISGDPGVLRNASPWPGSYATRERSVAKRRALYVQDNTTRA